MTNTELISKIKAEIERLKGKAERQPHATPLDVFEGIGKIKVCNELLSFLSTLESEKPMNPDDAMKELDEKIALVKQRGTWDGVDVDKYMDEVRGREPEKPVPNDLEEAAEKHASMHPLCNGKPAKNSLIAGAKWQKEQDEKELSDLLTIAHLQGAEQMKEQMLKEAVEVIVMNFSSNEPKPTVIADAKGFNQGDVVRVIVLPKED